MPPDLHALLELLNEINQVVTGLPGASRARDRGDDRHPQVGRVRLVWPHRDGLIWSALLEPASC